MIEEGKVHRTITMEKLFWRDQLAWGDLEFEVDTCRKFDINSQTRNRWVFLVWELISFLVLYETFSCGNLQTLKNYSSCSNWFVSVRNSRWTLCALKTSRKPKTRSINDGSICVYTLNSPNAQFDLMSYWHFILYGVEIWRGRDKFTYNNIANNNGISTKHPVECSRIKPTLF